MKQERHSRRLTPLTAAISLALAAPYALADDKAKEDDIEKIEVSGSFQQSLINRIAVTQKELPFTLDVVDSELIEARKA